MSEAIFSIRLSTLRRKRDLSQEQLANKSGLQAAAVSHFETGGRKPSFDNLRRLADALETTVDYLMGRTDSPEAVLPSGDKLFRDYDKLTADERDIARDFMATLAQRSKKGKAKD